jgi:hypothetical protein
LGRPHHIRKQTIEIAVASEALALALQPRLSDFNRRQFLPLIERLFDEFSAPGRQIKISKLDLDLGEIPFDRFEEVAAERFTAELRRAVEEALHRQRQSPTPDDHSQTDSASRLSLFEYYLRHGTLPFWASDGSVFSFDQLVSELAETDATGLIRIIKSQTHQRSPLERIVLQLGEAMLRRLLHLVEPEYGAVIIAYLTDLRLIHKVEPVIELSENEFNRSLWILALTYVLQEHGSQFNRKIFVKQLLEGLAADQGLNYEQLALEFRHAFQQMEKSQPLGFSLPAIVSEITQELNLDAASETGDRPALSRHESKQRADEVAKGEATPATGGKTAETLGKQEPISSDNLPPTSAASRLKLLEDYLLGGTLSLPASLARDFCFEEFLLELAENEPAGLVQVIRQHGHQRRVIERLVFQLGDESLSNLAHLLEPESATLIMACLTDLRAMHRVEPGFSQGENEFARSLWILTLTYLVQERRSQFNRKSFVKSLLQGTAQSDGLDFTEIVAMAQCGVRRLAKNRPLESSLSAIIAELMSELEESGVPHPSESHAGVETALRVSANDGPSTQDVAEKALPDALARLESCLAGEIEAAGDPKTITSDTRTLLRQLTENDLAAARQLIWQLAQRSGVGLSNVVSRLLRSFPPEDLLLILVPQQRQFIIGMAKVVTGASTQVTSPVRAQRVAIDNVFWTATLEYLLSDLSARWNRQAMVQQVVGAVAEHVAVSPAALADTLCEALSQAAGAPDTSLVRAVATTRQALVDQSSHGGPATPAFTWYDHFEVIRYYLRHGVLPWNALRRNPKMTPTSELGLLPGLPRSLLYAVFTEESPDKQLQAIYRAVRMMPEAKVEELLTALLTQAKEPGSPFRSALKTVLSKLEDKQQFYARLLAAIFNSHSMDLQEFAALAVAEPITVEPALAPDPTEWDVAVLKSVLANGLRFANTSDAAEHAPLALLDTLVAQHPEDARHFCRALRDTPDLLAALLKQCTPAHFLRLIHLLRPADSPVLDAVMFSIAGRVDAGPHSATNVREVTFTALLSLEASEPLTASFFARVLLKLGILSDEASELPGELPDELRKLLLLNDPTAEADTVDIPAAPVATAVASTTAEHAKRAGLRQPPAHRAAAFAFLRGDRKVHIAADSGAEVSPQRLESLSHDAIQYTLNRVLEDSPEDVYAFVTEQAQDSRMREHWVKTLPESTLARLTYLLEPRKHRSLLNAAEVLASAWLGAVPSRSGALSERQTFWSFLLDFLEVNPDSDRSLERLVTVFFEQVVRRYEAPLPDSSDLTRVGTRLLDCAGRLAGTAGQVSLQAVLLSQRKLLLASCGPLAATGPTSSTDLRNAEQSRSSEVGRGRRQQERSRMAFNMPDEKDAQVAGEPIYINNAGLVLTGPFLPHLFETLDLLQEDENGKTSLRHREAVSRAVHLLQYLVDGRTSAPEPLLVLNKILCGVPASFPVDREIEPTKDERAVCERLLQAMIANWTTISNTSIAGLQETFFRREGKLERRAGEWKLRVQRKTVDVLVDQVPWTVSVIYHRWMLQALYVDW